MRVVEVVPVVLLVEGAVVVVELLVLELVVGLELLPVEELEPVALELAGQVGWPLLVLSYWPMLLTT